MLLLLMMMIDLNDFGTDRTDLSFCHKYCELTSAAAIMRMKKN